MLSVHAWSLTVAVGSVIVATIVVVAVLLPLVLAPFLGASLSQGSSGVVSLTNKGL